jgi:hypothetical protein
MRPLSGALIGFLLGAFAGGFVAYLRLGDGYGAIAWPLFIAGGALFGTVVGFLIGVGEPGRTGATAPRARDRDRDE